MRKVKTSFAAILLLAVPAVVFGQHTLESLLKDRQYFELRRAVGAERTATPESLFYRAVVANRFNRLDESIELMDRYLREPKPTNARQAYEIQADNYLKTFQYGKAADTYQLLLDKFGRSVSQEERDGYANSRGLWNALRSIPRQSVAIDGEVKVQGTRDQANLLNVPVEIGGQKANFVFDTGANLSTITASTAAKLGLKIIDTGVSVGSSSDIKVDSKLAVAPEMKLGAAIVRNVVFLVLEDKSLFFPQIKYQIHGIVGFPVMEAIGRVTIARNNEVTLSTRRVESIVDPNLCLEDLKPLVQATVNGQDQIYAFDTGAVTTTFYPPFLEANRQSIVTQAKLEKMQMGGAGGAKQVSIYSLPKLQMTIAGKTAQFTKVKVLTEPVNDESRNFYGNLGQDLIKQFERMTLDFRAMRLEFE
jgi:hypothetical protein